MPQVIEADVNQAIQVGDIVYVPRQNPPGVVQQTQTGPNPAAGVVRSQIINPQAGQTPAAAAAPMQPAGGVVGAPAVRTSSPAPAPQQAPQAAVPQAPAVGATGAAGQPTDPISSMKQQLQTIRDRMRGVASGGGGQGRPQPGGYTRTFMGATDPVITGPGVSPVPGSVGASGMGQQTGDPTKDFYNEWVAAGGSGDAQDFARHYEAVFGIPLDPGTVGQYKPYDPFAPVQRPATSPYEPIPDARRMPPPASTPYAFDFGNTPLRMQPTELGPAPDLAFEEEV